MSMEWFRDLVICIAGLLSTAAIIFVAVLAYSCYRRIKPIMESIKATSSAVQGISSCVREDLARPLAEVVAIVQGVTQGINAVSSLFKKKEGGSNV